MTFRTKISLTLMALAASLSAGLSVAETWQPIEAATGDSLTWRKLCTGSEAGGTWSKLVGCVNNAFVFNQTIAGTTYNYNIRTAAVAAGWNQTTPLAATITINSGVVVGSTSTAVPAFSTDSGFPAGSRLKLINNGVIAGKGGKGADGLTWTAQCGSQIAATSGAPGGPALNAGAPITVTNYGTIGGGGGGGGAGITAMGGVPPYACGYPSPGFGFTGAGGGGGGAGGGEAGAGAVTPGLSRNGASDGLCFGAGQKMSGYNGAAASLTQAGAGGSRGSDAAFVCGTITTSSSGGAGGGLGAAGAGGAANNQGSTSGTTAGGAAGAAVVGNGNISWASTGTLLGGVQ